MATSRVNLSALVVAFIAGLVVLHDTQNLLTSVAGLTLLVVLFAFDQDGVRTGMQSLAFALVCGLVLLCTCSYPFSALLPAFGLSPTFQAQYFPAIFWLVGAAIFWVIDRSRAESGQPQHVSLSGYTQPIPSQYEAAPAPKPANEMRPFTPAPVVVSAPQPAPPPAQPEPVYTSSTPVSSTPAARPLPPAPPPPATVSTAAGPVPPVPSGKEVNIYVTMLGEGMNVLRAVRAEHLGRDFYMIVDEMPSDENWQYVPGQVVRCKKKNLSNGKGMVAYEEAPRAQ